MKAIILGVAFLFVWGTTFAEDKSGKFENVDIKITSSPQLMSTYIDTLANICPEAMIKPKKGKVYILSKLTYVANSSFSIKLNKICTLQINKTTIQGRFGIQKKDGVKWFSETELCSNNVSGGADHSGLSYSFKPNKPTKVSCLFTVNKKNARGASQIFLGKKFLVK